MIPLYILVFLFGITVGSFLNVLIYRIPKGENFTTTRSHCMNCDYQLRWYDLVPLFSYISLGGKCRSCGTPISKQYPLIEFINGALWLVTAIRYGFTLETLLYCLFISALLALSVIDFRTFEIPQGFNIFIALLGIVRIATDLSNWQSYLIGALSVGGFLMLLFVLSKGAAIGGGDVKLMAASGLLLGWKLNLLAFILGCVLGSVIHIARMRISGEGRQLAMGPYLSLGLVIAVFAGGPLINWYMSLLGL